MQSPTSSEQNHIDPPSQSRREFLTKTALLTGGILAFGLPLPSRQSQSALAAPKPQSAGIRYVLDLEGQIAGPIASLESGFIAGQVSAQPLSQIPYPKKHLSTIIYEDIAIQCGNNMSPSLYHWIQQALEGNLPQKAGAILTTDLSNQLLDRKIFPNAVLTEVAFPTLDRSANTPVSLGIKIQPTQLSYQSGGGQIPFPSTNKPQAWLASNFRITIEGLEQACAHVVRVESLIWQQQVSQGQIGDRRSAGPTPGPIHTPNLILTLPQAQAGPFTQWFYQFVVQGQASDSEERSGVLECLAPDQQTPLFALHFDHLGIFRMSPVPTSSTNPVPLVKVEMYCEAIHLTHFPGGGSSTSQSQSLPSQPQTPPPQQKSILQPPTKSLSPRLPLKR